MLIDTHAHIYLDRFDDDRKEMLARAKAAGVGIILMPAIDVASIHASIALCERYEGLFAMAALHPSETGTATDDDFREVTELARHSSVVAIGETGLDYYWDRTFDDAQHEFLRRHIRLAIAQDLPLILHNREAGDDLVRILREEKDAAPDPGRLRGIFHCFGGSLSFTRDVLDLGFHVGIGGTVTFKKSTLGEVLNEVPLEHIVLETDAPFLAPVPFRGKRNEPAYLPFIAEKVASIKGLTVEALTQITTENARRLFDLSG